MSDDDLQARRRAFIRANHPDVGGDPDAFMAGLAAFDGTPRPTGPAPGTRPRVRRSRRVDRVLLRALRTMRRRRAGQPPRNLK